MSRCRFGRKNNSPAILYGNGFLPRTLVSTEISICFLMRYRNSEFRNRNSNFLTLQTLEFKKYFPTRIFEIKSGIRIPLTMGVPEIGTKNQNSQPSGITDRELNTLAARRLKELFSNCADVSVFLFWQEIGFGFTYLCT